MPDFDSRVFVEEFPRRFVAFSVEASPFTRVASSDILCDTARVIQGWIKVIRREDRRTMWTVHLMVLQAVRPMRGAVSATKGIDQSDCVCCSPTSTGTTLSGRDDRCAITLEIGLRAHFQCINYHTTVGIVVACSCNSVLAEVHIWNGSTSAAAALLPCFEFYEPNWSVIEATVEISWIVGVHE